MRIAIVAGETSGDYLASKLIHSLRRRHPQLSCEGIAGPRMIEAGCEAMYAMERLSVMGFTTEVFGRLNELLRIRRNLANRWRNRPPHVFIGVDAPAFNIGLEIMLKRAGIKTIQYVSPQVWAWRPGRIKNIKKAVDTMLTIFPFETQIYRENNIPVEFVGHSLADEIPIESDKAKARIFFELTAHAKVLAILPGSRSNEIRALAKDFIYAAVRLQKEIGELKILMPLAQQKHVANLRAMLNEMAPDLQCHICVNQARQAMTAADAVLTTSGTASLEAMLIKRPMVVAYRMQRASYWLAKRLVKTSFIALPNLLAGKAMVPEFVQDDVQPEKIASALVRHFTDVQYVKSLQEKFTVIHQQLKNDASEAAARVVLALLPAKL